MDMTNEELLRLVRQCLANTELMAALKELLARTDQDALNTIRGASDEVTFQEARDILRHNDRFRYYFRQGLTPNQKDPFDG